MNLTRYLIILHIIKWKYLVLSRMFRVKNSINFVIEGYHAVTIYKIK